MIGRAAVLRCFICLLLLCATAHAQSITSGTPALAGVTATPNAPSGTTSTAAQVMMGLGVAFTPTATGRALVVISGNVVNTTGGDGAEIQIRYGTGTAPTNGAAATGTTVGGAVAFFPASGAANFKVPFTLSGYVTGLTIGTAIWVDSGLRALTGGTAGIANLSVTVLEQ